jgi:hypothetical protein
MPNRFSVSAGALGAVTIKRTDQNGSDWRLATGDWKLATGDWRLAIDEAALSGERLSPRAALSAKWRLTNGNFCANRNLDQLKTNLTPEGRNARTQKPCQGLTV